MRLFSLLLAVCPVALLAAPTVTVTLGARNAPSSIQGSVITPMTDPVFRYSEAPVSYAGSTFPNTLFFASSAAALTSTYGSLPYSIDFQFTGRVFEISTLGSGGGFRISIDGKLTTRQFIEGLIPSDGNGYLIRVEVRADAGPQRRYSAPLQVHIETDSIFKFGGVQHASADRVLASTQPRQDTAIFFGDSFTEPAWGYAYTAAKELGLTPWFSGSGATGYLNPGTVPGRVKLRDRVATDVIAQNPQWVFVAAGINDSSYLEQQGLTSAQITSAIHTEASQLYGMLKSGLPNARIIIVGPWWSNGSPAASVIAVRDGLQIAATEAGFQFVDPIASQWITGNHDDPASGNSAAFIGPDGTHPTYAGAAYLGMRLAQAVNPSLTLVR